MTRARPSGPVTASERVSDVLARDEALVGVFARHSPNFARLRSRAMRRVMAPLVTVEQAARIAGVPVGALLHDLNAALGIGDAPAPACARSAGEAPAVTPVPRRPVGAREVALDVRPLLRAGEEPFSRIMAAVAALGADEVLHLRATFEPHPLLAVMAKRGFLAETAEHSPDDWSAWFWRAGAAAASPAAEVPAPTPRESPAETRVLELDVRNLEPPEPLMRTLAALESLPTGWSLLQINSRVPQLLFPLLAEQGYACDADESHADRVLVRIWRPQAAPPSAVR